MRQKLIAAAAALTLGSFAAVGAFASQDAVDLRAAGNFLSGGVLGAEVAPLAGETATATATETATPDATETSTPEATETGTPEATGTAEPTGTPDASATPDDDEECDDAEDSDDDDSDEEHGTPVSATSAGDPGNASCDDDDVQGIPDDNPSHEPEDGDGECEHGETSVNTTPSGQQVNVPCQASHDGEHGQGHGHEDGDDQDDQDDHEDANDEGDSHDDSDEEHD